ncbi:hypothetical protein [Desulforhopalus sp. IMCC35007]|uniref:hypothetical protein n=1 Tax=Desulforhopalus sp. IMCC35007 TaxID=2569543 RepID=UPI0010AEB033|nr:hypothetical protein [Desulforhopalus sp. IMCC35007]TKB11605.1 hypothetical protein FCL48_02050 [Desulforhopalus sp. IMCC35007]
MKGATTEFRKEEGISSDSNTSTLYVAMSAIAKNMEASGKMIPMGQTISDCPKKCGSGYELDIAPDASFWQ